MRSQTQFWLHVPAWHNAAKGEDMPPRKLICGLVQEPQIGHQIEVPDGGLVEVVNVRHHPTWTEEGGQAYEFVSTAEGGGTLFFHDAPEVFTNWVDRPEGAKKFRTRSGRI